MTFLDEPEEEKLKIHRISDFTTDILNERVNGIARGKLLGFPGWRDAFSIVQPSTTYLYGAPSSGKTTLKYSILRQLTDFYGWNHLVFDPETGMLRDTVSRVIKVLAGKDISNTYNNQMDMSELAITQSKANEHFFLADPFSRRLTPFGLIEAAKRLQDETGKKIHTISIDPWNYLYHDYSKYGGRMDLYLEEVLPQVFMEALREEIHIIIVNHVVNQTQRSRKVDGEQKFYLPPARAEEVAGGQVWFRMGMGMMCIWRPPDWWVDEHGYLVKDYEAHVFFHKKKPEGVGEEGDLTKMSKLWLDPRNKRYYEFDDVGSRVYPNKPVKRAIKLKDEDNDPFTQIDLSQYAGL